MAEEDDASCLPSSNESALYDEVNPSGEEVEEMEPIESPLFVLFDVKLLELELPLIMAVENNEAPPTLCGYMLAEGESVEGEEGEALPLLLPLLPPPR